MELTQEQIKNMSPDELREFQKQNCIFCQIASDKVSSKKVYEDAKVFAILDINPANPGHMLLLPKEHYQIMPQVPDDIIGHMLMVAKGLSHACLRGLKTQGCTIIAANGIAAGQKAPHFILHVIPRMNGDGLSFTLPENEPLDEHLKAFALLKPSVEKAFGLPVTAMPIKSKTTEAPKNKDETVAKAIKPELPRTAAQREVNAEFSELPNKKKPEQNIEAKNPRFDLDAISEMLTKK